MNARRQQFAVLIQTAISIFCATQVAVADQAETTLEEVVVTTASERDET